MPIDTNCPDCHRTLRVAEEYAGQQARCPACGGMYTVPAVSNAAVAENTAAQEHASQPQDTSRWSLKTPEGAIYGPVDRATLDQWLADGRIAGDCYLAEGESVRWQRAEQVYPQLATAAASQAPPQQSQQYGDTPAGSGLRSSTVGYQAMGQNTHLRPHRGGLILALGVLGVVTCQLLGIMAWIMGSDDLKEIRAGRMDPSGEGLTQAGTVLGMISALLAAISLMIAVLFLFLAAGMAAMN